MGFLRVDPPNLKNEPRPETRAPATNAARRERVDRRRVVVNVHPSAVIQVAVADGGTAGAVAPGTSATFTSVDRPVTLDRPMRDLLDALVTAVAEDGSVCPKCEWTGATDNLAAHWANGRGAPMDAEARFRREISMMIDELDRIDAERYEAWALLPDEHDGQALELPESLDHRLERLKDPYCSLPDIAAADIAAAAVLARALRIKASVPGEGPGFAVNTCATVTARPVNFDRKMREPPSSLVDAVAKDPAPADAAAAAAILTKVLDGAEEDPAFDPMPAVDPTLGDLLGMLVDAVEANPRKRPWGVSKAATTLATWWKARPVDNYSSEVEAPELLRRSLDAPENATLAALLGDLDRADTADYETWARDPREHHDAGPPPELPEPTERRIERLDADVELHQEPAAAIAPGVISSAILAHLLKVGIYTHYAGREEPKGGAS